MSNITRKKDLIEKDLKKAFKWFFILVMLLFFVSLITTTVFSNEEKMAKNKVLCNSIVKTSSQNYFLNYYYV